MTAEQATQRDARLRSFLDVMRERVEVTAIRRLFRNLLIGCSISALINVGSCVAKIYHAGRAEARLRATCVCPAEVTP